MALQRGFFPLCFLTGHGPSPYSTTILLERPQQAKMTVKADIIFEEYIGLDLHETLVLKKGNSAKVNYKGGKRLPRCNLSADVCTVEKDNTVESSVSTQNQNTCMPTFKLIDEDSGEENEPYVAMEYDDCLIINERTVFDHIREKAKCFPSLSMLNPASPTSKISSQKRKSLWEEFPKLNAKFQAPQETPRKRIENDPMLGLPTDTKDNKQNVNSHGDSLDLEQQVKMSDFANLVENPGETQRPFTDKTVFDHIRKKSKNFPVLNASNTDHSENFLPKNSYSGIEHQTADPIIISCLEDGNTEVISSASSFRLYGMLSPSLRRPSVTPDPSPVEMLSFDISMTKRNTKQKEEPGTSRFNTMKRMGFSSLVPGKSNDSDSFLGFKSIFSFL